MYVQVRTEQISAGATLARGIGNRKPLTGIHQILASDTSDRLKLKAKLIARDALSVMKRWKRGYSNDVIYQFCDSFDRIGMN
jgi:hypothetical protein